MKLKEDFATVCFYYSGIAKRNGVSYEDCIWIGEPKNGMYKFSYYRNILKPVFLTQKDIDELPYGFIKMHDVIEVKEQLYYIKMPYTDSEF